MTVIVQSKSIPVTKALRSFVNRQASKVAKFSSRILQISVYLENISKKSNDPSATAVKYFIQIPGKDIVVKRQAANMYDAIVDATDRAMRQVRKAKEKRIDGQRQVAAL